MTTAPARDLDSITVASHAQQFARRMRVRVGVAISGVLFVVSLLFTIQSALTERWAFTVVDLITTIVVGSALYMFRRHHNPTVPSMMVLAWMLLAIAGVGITQEGLLGIVTSVWSGLVALLSLYLLGSRHGSVLVGILLLEIIALWLLHQSGVSLPSADVGASPRWTPLVNALGIAIIGLFGYLYEAAQKRSLGELADALIASEQNERQLEALFESTNSAICSLDRDLRLLTCNRAFAALLPGASPPGHGEALQSILAPAQWARWQTPIERVLAGDSGPTAFEEPPPPGQDRPHRETVMHPLMVGDRVIGVTVFSRDITARKRAEAEMSRLNQELVRVSRQAGMAAVAGEVLHNAGNVLNSTGVSVSMIDRHVRNLKTGHLSRATALLEQHRDTLDVFLRDDPRGRPVLELLRGLADHFEQQQQQLTAELASLRENTEHLARVIQAQQSHARALGIIETVSVAELIDAALALQAPSWDQLGVTVERRLASLPPLHTDRHKVLEILLNLVSNARHALRDSDRPDKRLVIRAEAADDNRVRIHVEDNGPGIASEHREKLFRLGFTTKQDGNGIGLHASAIAAQQLGGSLSFHSDGPGRGATFTLELPVVSAAGSAAGPATRPAAQRASE